jgi:hypothetical protein
MNRRDFFKTSIIPIAAFSARKVEALSGVEQNAFPEADQEMVKHCRRILEQNLLKAGERLIIATSHQYDREFTRGMLLAGAEIGATGGHLVVLPSTREEEWFSPDCGATRGLTPWHWDLYADTDLLFIVSPRAGARKMTPLKYKSGTMPVLTSYEGKLGDHPYRTDFERLCREGSKTRWMKMGGSFAEQVKYFPTQERKELTLKACRAVHEGKEIRVTSDSGTDFVTSKEGRPAHAQYGIADLPGRWDNFGFGCLVIAPQEYIAEGVVMMEPGDMMQVYPGTWPEKDMILTEPAKITFEGGYITKIEGGKVPQAFATLLKSFGGKENYGIGHIGFGTHENVDVDAPYFAHHNKIGSILFSMGANMGHGLGGPALNYSGLGESTRIAPTHTHFAVYSQNFYCDGTQLVDKGRLLL